jgi:TolB protein
VNGDHDTRLGQDLGRLGVPEHGPAFWTTLEAGLEIEAHDLYQQRDKALGECLDSLPLAGHRDDYWQAMLELVRDESRVVALSSRRRRHGPRRFAVIAAAIAAGLLLAAWFGMPGSVGGTESAIARGFLSPLQKSLSPACIDGDTLFWMSRRAPDFDSGQTDANIFARDVTGGEPFAISTHRSSKLQLTSSGGLVAWLDDRDQRPAIYVYDLGTRVEQRVAFVGGERPAWAPPLAADPGLGHLGEPAVSGSRVVWTDERGDIRGFDLASETPFGVATRSWGEQEPAISGDVVAWSDGRGTTWGFFGTYMNGWEIWARDLSSGRTFPVCQAKGDQIAPAISGTTIVWQDGRARTTRDRDNWDIYGYDLLTGREFPIATGPGAQTAPAISGNFVVWSDDATAAEPAGTTVAYTTIEGLDLRTGRQFPVSDQAGVLRSPSISGHRIVWSALSDRGELAVYGASISQRGSTVHASPIEP